MLFRSDVALHERLEFTPTPACARAGEQVVTQVTVGTGSRIYRFRNDKSGAISVEKLKIEGLEAGIHQHLNREHHWTEPLAYAFAATPMVTTASIDLRVRMEPADNLVDDCGLYQLHVNTQSPAWVLVLYADSDGQMGISYPVAARPEGYETPGGEQEVPIPLQFMGFLSPSRRAAQAVSEESLFIYAFRHIEHFRQLNLPLGPIDHKRFAAWKTNTFDPTMAGLFAGLDFEVKTLGYRVRPAGKQVCHD